MNAWLNRLAQWVGIDFHIQQTLLLRGWQVISGGVMLIFVAHWMTGIEQGFYYTFSSLIALQIFFELGLNYVVMQIVSHESAHLRIGSTGELEGDPVHIDRIAALVALLRYWYRIGASLFFLGVGTFGMLFLSRSNALPVEEWLPAWCILIALVSGNLYLSPMLAVFEGCGQVGQIAQLRLKQAITGSLLTWMLLSFGAGLVAVAALPIVDFIFSIWWLNRRGQLVNALRIRGMQPLLHRIVWRTEIFPLQWRIALSWISGYFIFQLFSPMVFAHQGAVEAGRIGMTIAIFGALSNISMSWVNAKLPQLGAYVSRGDRAKLNNLFVITIIRSILFITITSSSFIILSAILINFKFAFIERISSVPILACLAVTAITNTFIFSAAGYMRAHREEPMLAPSICIGALTLAAVYFGSSYSVFFAVFLSTLITVFVGLPWTIFLFIPYYRRSP
jgi:hypothetical protein